MNRNKKGFTLIELLTVVSVTAIIGAIGALSIPSTFREEKTLDLVAGELLVNLRGAQQRSISQDQGQQWGVRLNPAVDANNSYYLFSGADYASGTVVKTVTLPPTVQFYSPSQGDSPVDIIFEKITGSTASRSIILALTNNLAVRRYIVIGSKGLLSGPLSSASAYDFSILLNPSSGIVAASQLINVAITLTLISGAPQQADFSASNLPNGVSASFNPASCTPSLTCSSTLTLATGVTTPVGTSQIFVTATAGTTTRTANFTLTVGSITAPSNPQNLSAVSSGSKIDLSWQIPLSTGGSPITNYKVYRGISSGGETFLGNAGLGLSYSDAAVTPGTTYYYKVSAENAPAGEGDKSNEASVLFAVIPDANLYGYAWSSNIGWLSFNCANNSSCGVSNYKVIVGGNFGLLSGYAWSSNIGWLSFNSSDLSGCPNAPCEARVTNGLGGVYPKNLTGWGKIIATGDWLSLFGALYGVSADVSGNFSGYGWSSGDIGWLSFNCLDRGVCGQSNYKVSTTTP